MLFLSTINPFLCLICKTALVTYNSDSGDFRSGVHSVLLMVLVEFSLVGSFKLGILNMFNPPYF